MMLMFAVACNVSQKTKPGLEWQQYAELPGIDGKPSLGYAGPVTGIHQNMLIVAGGANFPDSMPWLGGRKKYYDIACAMDLSNRGAVDQKFSLPYPVAYSANCSTADGIVSAGGENEQGMLSSVLLIRYDHGQLLFTALPSLPVPLTNAAATVIGKNIYVAGGESATGASSGFFKLNFDDTARGWQPLESIPHAISHTVLLAAPGGRHIWLLGGRKKNSSGISELYKNVYEYNVAGNSWVEKQSLPYPLSAGSGAVINDQYIAMFGGDKGATFHQTELLIKAINNEKDAIKKQQLIKEKAALQSGHPGFSDEILLYDIKKNEWHNNGRIPYPAPVTTTAVKNWNSIFIPSGEIKAGVRTPWILKAEIK